ncbi:MAG: peptidyl-prolyl cis-trans isomerase [Lachnospiraceae bacterium]|nr:peptidyl-prolyl cis-trans isomerase [Lachnospiraceae bacterium]
MKKSIKLGITAGMLAVLSLSSCGVADTDAVATVYGEEVTVGEAGLYAIYQQVQYEQFYSMYLNTAVDWSQEYDGVTMEDETKKSMLDQFKKMQIVAAHAGDYNITISEDEAAKINEAAQKLVSANDDKAKKALHISEESAVALFETYYLNNKVSAAMVADVDTNVSDEEAAQKKMSYVQFSLDDTTDEEGNTVSLSDEEKAAIKAKAEEVAAAANMESAVEGTDYSVSTVTFDEESNTLEEEVYAEANKLKEGQTSSVIETEAAYYVVRLDSEFDQEATNNKKEDIVSQRKSDAFDKLYDEWAAEEDAFVLNDKVWASIRFKDKITLAAEEEGSSADDEGTPEEEEGSAEDTDNAAEGEAAQNEVDAKTE